MDSPIPKCPSPNSWSSLNGHKPHFGPLENLGLRAVSWDMEFDSGLSIYSKHPGGCIECRYVKTLTVSIFKIAWNVVFTAHLVLPTSTRKSA